MKFRLPLFLIALLAPVILARATTPTATAGQLLINEFRLRGPSGANDEYVEIYNASGAAHTVAAVSGTGYALVASDGVTRFTIPNGTVIPAYGYFLGVNTVGFSLGNHPAGSGTVGTGDATYTTDIADNAGIALFNNNTGGASFSVANRIDAVGTTSEADTLYKMGTALPAITAFSIDYCWHRIRQTGAATGTANDPTSSGSDGLPRATNNNANDFIFEDTNGTSAGGGQRLGAPGPKKLSSPIGAYPAVAANMTRTLLDPAAGLSGAPNRVLDVTSDPSNNSTFGTWEVRRKFFNNTGAPLTRLRFRIIKLTTFPVPNGFADLRPRTSADLASVSTSDGNVAVMGTTLEMPPNQFNGGGVNSTFSVTSVTAATPLAAGASINVRLLFGIQQTGTRTFAVIAEGLPGPVSQLWYVTGDATTDSETIGGPVPTVTTPTSASVADTTATLGGNVTSGGGSTVTERGVVYALTSANTNPQIGGTGVTKVAGTGTTGVFTVPVTGLTAGRAYTYAAYATNSAGSSYSTTGTFTTLVSDTTGSAGTASPVAVNNAQPTLAVRWMICTQGIYPSRETEPGNDPFIGEIRPFAIANATLDGWAECNGQILSISSNTALFSLLGIFYGGDGTTTFALPDLRGRVPVIEGQGTGLTNRVLGEMGGVESNTLTVANLPAHAHSTPLGTTGSTGSGTALNNMQPWVGLNAFITSGVVSDAGWVRFCAGSAGLQLGLPCNGATLNIANYPSLFAVLGTKFGGNGTTTFRVPDLRGRSIVGVGQGADRALGATGGTETIALTTANLPAHSHTIVGGSTGSTGSAIPHDTMQPFVAMTWSMATSGIFLGANSSPALCELRLRAYAFSASGWTPAVGGTLSIAANQAVFSLLGTTFGGNGTTTFGLPDAQGRSLAHAGTGPGLTERLVGDTWGSETASILLTNMPAHTHSYAREAIVAPSVASVGVPSAGTAKLGTALNFTVNWSAAVNVTGTPTLALKIGSTPRTASYVSGTGTTATVFRYTVQVGDSDTDGITVGALALAGGTIKDASLNDAILTLASVGSTASLNVDGIVPTLSPVAITSSNSNTGRARADDVVTLTFTASEAIATPTVSVAGHTVTATNTSGNSWTATYTMNAADAQTAVAFSIGFADLAGNAGTPVTATTNSSSVIFDNTAPTISASRISLSGATGTGGAFRIGDTVTATWNNTASGDNNTDVASVTITFTQFGGATATATSSGGNWSASLVLTAGAIDATSRNVSVSARDTTGNLAVVAGTNNATVDRVAPVVTAPRISLGGATGTGGVFKAGDTITASWDNTAAGDNNADIAAVTVNFSAFGGGSAVAAKMTSNVWSASCALPAGSLEASNLNVAVTATDDAGNATTQTGTNNATVDVLAPTAPSAPDLADASDSGRLNNDNITNVTAPVLTGTAAPGSTVKLFSGATQLGSATAGAGGAWSITSSTLTAGSYTITATATDTAGNVSTSSSGLAVVIDTAAPAAPAVTAIADDTGSSKTDGITKDTTLVLSGTAEAGATVTLAKGGNSIGSTTANESGTWTFDYTGTTLGAGEHSFTATATDVAGNTSGNSATFLVTIDTTAPGVPTIAAISDDTGTAGDRVTKDPTLIFSGTADPGVTVTVSRNAVGVIGTATALGTGAWSFDYTGTTLADGVYIFTATATDVAGNTSAASADFPVTVDTTAPVITASTASGTYNSAFSYSISATGSAVSYGAKPLPAGVVLNSATGALSGTPAAAGSTTVSLTATDLAGNTGTATLTITIAKATPVISWVVPGSITYGDTLSATQLNATANVPGSFTYTPAAGSIQAAGTRTLSVAFMPTDAANYNALPATTVSLSVQPRTVTLTGATASSKVYDGSATAALSIATATITNRVGSDDVTVSATGATAVFGGKSPDATVGTAKQVLVSGLSLTGSTAANYVIGLLQLTADITPKPLTISGLSAASRNFNGGTATAISGTPVLVGIVGSDAVSLTGTPVGSFATGTVGTGKLVSLNGLSLTGAAAGNYTLTLPALSANISPGVVSIAISGLSYVYDGASKSASVSVNPPVPYSVTYGGSASAPTAPGTYTVAVSVYDSNYSGYAADTLVIAKAAQTVAFSAPGGALTIGAPVTISATASSGLPVTFSVVSGPASVGGSFVTMTETGTAVIRATQPGNEFYSPASAEITVTAAAKLAQTIAFASLGNKFTTDTVFTLSATASSGLPVSFVVSGPASISGATVTLTGASGAVTVRASQAGNGAYLPAADVTRSFNVLGRTEHQVFFGLTQNRDNVAVDIAPDQRSGTLICFIAATGESFVVTFTINPDGTFSATVVPEVGIAASPLIDGRRTGRAAAARTFSGQLKEGLLTGSIVELGLRFSAAVQPSAGSTAGLSGLYVSNAVNSAGGTTTTIVGTEGQVVVVSTMAGVSTGGAGTIDASGHFTVQATGATISGTVDKPTTTMAGTVSVTGQTPVSFSGIAVNAERTDRLANLSSRVRIVPATGRTLITGFVIGGAGEKRVLLRAVGPALSGFGVNGAVTNPRLQLFDAAGRVLVENDDWSGADVAEASAAVGAFALTPGARDSALLARLAPGAYSIQITAGTEAGDVLAEIYDASPTSGTEPQRLINISARGTVDGSTGPLIGGFVVTGNVPKKVLVRGVGPALGAFGVGDALTDPRLAIYQGTQVVAQNDDWSTPTPVNAQQVAASGTEIAEAARGVGAFAFGAGAKDAAILVTLAPGAYTAQVAGPNATATGVALVEIYEVP